MQKFKVNDLVYTPYGYGKIVNPESTCSFTVSEAPERVESGREGASEGQTSEKSIVCKSMEIKLRNGCLVYLPLEKC